ncbi:anti-sigma regulatory factor [Bacillus sp. SCS-153A]|uniref:anti-sigma regulatory factor n=1 Tax=Rossellomorea sedimentorum TaxID=3115294 RepID=UPI003905890B
MNSKVVIIIESEEDIIIARKKVRELSDEYSFNPINRAKLLTSVSELARNIFRYAGEGQIQLELVMERIKKGIVITAADKGPGIEDINKAMERGFSSSGSLGAGLPGVKAIMDEFYIESSSDTGTKITVMKWELL